MFYRRNGRNWTGLFLDIVALGAFVILIVNMLR